MISKKKKTAKKTSTKKTSKSKKPQTMEELLKLTGYELRAFKVRDVVEGTITEKTKKALYLDIGGKTEGMVIDREMKAAKDFIEGLKVGDKVEAVVTQPENEKGQTLLSLKRAAADHLWAEFEEKLKTGQTVKVKGKEVNPGGLVVDTKGLQGFIPSSQFGSKLVGKIQQLVNREIEAKPIEVDREKNRLILSEREVSEAELLQAQKQVLKKVKVGDIFTGQVTGVMPFGLFVRVIVPNGKRVTQKRKEDKSAKEGTELEGLVHISEVSWEKVEDPGGFYKEGDKVKVKVLAIDKSTGKLNLSIKQLQLDPWEEVEKKYPPESKVKGKIVKLAPFGAFVHFEPGIEGLIHLSKIPVEKSLKVGDKVDCYVESIDKEARRMSLGLVLKEKPVGYK